MPEGQRRRRMQKANITRAANIAWAAASGDDMSEDEDLSNCTDEELVEKSRGGDSAAADLVMERYKGMVRGLSRTMYLQGADEEDLIQEGMIGLFQALRDYDPQKEASFKTFAALCVRRNLYSAVEAASRRKHEPLNTALSYDAVLPETSPAGSAGVMEPGTGEESTPGAARTVLDVLASPADDPETSYISEESLYDMETAIRKELSPLEKQVYELYLSGMNYHDIAARLSREPKSIDNALQRIRRKVRGLL